MASKDSLQSQIINNITHLLSLNENLSMSYEREILLKFKNEFLAIYKFDDLTKNFLCLFNNLLQQYALAYQGLAFLKSNSIVIY